MVAATARRPEQLADLVHEYGERVLPLALDVTDATCCRNGDRGHPATVRNVSMSSSTMPGTPTYPRSRPVPTTISGRSSKRTSGGSTTFRRLRSRYLRAQGGGLIIQFSSAGGRVGRFSRGSRRTRRRSSPSTGSRGSCRRRRRRSASRVLVVEPSGFATDWAGASIVHRRGPRSIYADTVGAMSAGFARVPR